MLRRTLLAAAVAAAVLALVAMGVEAFLLLHFVIVLRRLLQHFH